MREQAACQCGDEKCPQPWRSSGRHFASADPSLSLHVIANSCPRMKEIRSNHKGSFRASIRFRSLAANACV